MKYQSTMVVGCLLFGFLTCGQSQASVSVDHHSSPEQIVKRLKLTLEQPTFTSLLTSPVPDLDWDYIPRVKLRNAGDWKGIVTLEFQPKPPFTLALGYNNGVDVTAQLNLRF